MRNERTHTLWLLGQSERRKRLYKAESMDDLVEGQNKKGPKPIGIRKRFWKRVNKNGSIPKHCPELGNCWEWTGKIWGKTRPMISVCNTWLLTSRISYMMNVGRINPGMYVCHKCDNPLCVNPSHLVQGTAKYNTQDSIKKQRMLVGEKNGMAKLTESDVLTIRADYMSGERSAHELADDYGVWFPCIYKIINRVRWSHI